MSDDRVYREQMSDERLFEILREHAQINHSYDVIAQTSAQLQVLESSITQENRPIDLTAAPILFG